MKRLLFSGKSVIWNVWLSGLFLLDETVRISLCAKKWVMVTLLFNR